MPIIGPTENLPLWGYAARTAIVFPVLLAAVRVMGLREVAQLTPFDFAVAVTIGSIAATTLARSTSDVAGTIVSISTFAALQVALACLSIRSRRLGRLFSGAPDALIADGRIVEGNMKRARVNNEELLSLLRAKGVPDIADVEFAVLEPNGRLSVIRRSQVEPATPRDLGLPTPYRGLPVVLVDDGEVKDRELARAGLGRAWLLDELAGKGFSPADVLLATLSTQGFLFVQEKEARRRRRRR